MKPGVYTALITPFASAGFGIEEDLFRTLIERQIKAGVTGIIVNGSTGEGQSLNETEKQTALKIALRYKDQLEIVAACGSFSTWETLEQVRAIKETSCSTLMLSTPPYNKPPQRGLLQHFKTVAEAAAPLEILAYNVPGRTSVNLEASTMAKLLRITNIAGIKEASGDKDQVREILEKKPHQKLVLSGEDPLNAFFYENGGDGIVSVLSNVVPRLCVEQYQAAVKKDEAKVKEIQGQVAPLIDALFIEANPIAVKWSLGQILAQSLSPRAPLPDLDPSYHELLQKALTAIKKYEDL